VPARPLAAIENKREGQSACSASIAQRRFKKPNDLLFWLFVCFGGLVVCYLCRNVCSDGFVASIRLGKLHELCLDGSEQLASVLVLITVQAVRQAGTQRHVSVRACERVCVCVRVNRFMI